jgi:hypothetical protein
MKKKCPFKGSRWWSMQVCKEHRAGGGSGMNAINGEPWGIVVERHEVL